MKIKKKYQNYKKIKKKEVKFTIFIRNITYFIKIFIVLMILFVATKNIGINNLRNNLLDIRENINSIQVNNIEKHYYSCFCSMGKKENLYIRELVSYYINLGIDKFVLGDNNLPNVEKFSDVLQDYIKNGTVDILDIIGKIYDHAEYFDILYQKYKYKCGWLTFFDLDEYLVLFSDEGKKLKINDFLSNKKFDDCSSISFNWLMYDDNDLVYYDNRTSIERFTRPDNQNKYNRFIKSIIRRGIEGTVFKTNESCHMPQKDISQCNPMGQKILHSDSLSPPMYKYGYIMHFNTRTADEYTKKMIRGYPPNKFYNIIDRVNLFFYHNNFTKEKLKIFEKVFNKTFHIIPRKK